MARKIRMLAWVQLWCVGSFVTALGSESTLFLEGGTLNDVALSPSAPEITLPAGAAISGTLQVRSTALAPSLIVATPTWGPHIHAFWGVNVDVPLGEEFLSFAVDLVAPPVEGTYYLAVAMAPAPNPAHLATGTDPSAPLDWTRTHYISALPPEIFEKAMEDGWIPFDWWTPDGAKPGALALTAVRVKVTGNLSHLTLKSATLNGGPIDVESPGVQMEAGRRITGTLRLAATNVFGGAEPVRIAASHTWGRPEKSFWEVQESAASGTTEFEVNVDLPGPAKPGYYYLLVAMAPARTAAHLMSGTDSTVGPSWENGLNVARLTDSGGYIPAMRQGWIPFSWYHPEGLREGTLALAAVEIQVPGHIKVWIQAGAVSDTEVRQGQQELSVDPLTPLRGAVELLIENAMPWRSDAPLATTPTWGDPRTSFWEVSEDVPAGDNDVTVSIDLVAPEAAGTYYLAFALSGSYSAELICSGTHPAYDVDWETGNILALRPAAEFEQAMKDGWIPFGWQGPDGPLMGDIALNALRVVVGLRGDVDGDGARDVDDAVRLLSHLFLGGDPPVSPRAGDADASGAVDLTDAVFLVRFLAGDVRLP